MQKQKLVGKLFLHLRNQAQILIPQRLGQGIFIGCMSKEGLQGSKQLTRLILLEQRINALALPASNRAQYESQVALTRDQVLLEGRVRGQSEGVFYSDDGLSRSGGGWQIVTAGGKYTGAIKYL